MDPNFRTPEETAASDDVGTTAEPPVLPGPQPNPPKSDLREKLGLTWPPTNRTYLFVGILLILIAGSTAYFISQSEPPKPAYKPIPKIVKPTSTTVPSTLTGLPVDPSTNKLPVTGVMIENSLDARPQSGLGEAGVVFEAVAEGGITRFLALYQDTAPNDIGPIRSARPYYVRWVRGFDAGYAHVGGSPEALGLIPAIGVRDLDQFHNATYYHRISSRVAPHNVYTSMVALHEMEGSKGYNSSNYKGFLRKAKASPAKVPTARTIDITMSGPLYNVHYDYNPATNSYNRSEGGAGQVDANNSSQPISVPVVIAIVVPTGIASDGHHSEYSTTGTGTAYIFQDGITTVGRWNKPSDPEQIQFYDSKGKAFPLIPGRTWITAIADDSKVVAAP